MEQKEKKQQIKVVKQKKKLSVWAKVAIALGGVVLVCILTAGILGLSLLQKLSRPETPTVFAPDDEELHSEEPTPAATALPGASVTPALSPTPTPEVILPLSEVYPQTLLSDDILARMEQNATDTRYTNILLIGVDRRQSRGDSRADTLMIATIDRVNKRLKLTSLLRDTLVNIPGKGYDKLNTSASAGGVALLMQTVNETLHLNITEYVLVDFYMFEKIIDEMGGITVKMTAAEISAANDCIAGLNKQRGESYLWDGFIFANPGNVKLTGKQALGYARVRHLDNDFKRTNRQFAVLTAAFAKFMNAKLAKQYDMLNDLLPLVETNMTDASILDCMVSALGLNSNGLLHFRVPADGLYKSGSYSRKSVLMADLPANAWAMHQFMFDSAEEPEKAQVLKPGASLPPRTPSPTYLFPEYPIPSEGVYVEPTPVPTPMPTPTPSSTPAQSITPEPTQDLGVTPSP